MVSKGRNKWGTRQQWDPLPPASVCVSASLPRRRVWQPQQVSECLWLMLLRLLPLVNLMNFGWTDHSLLQGCSGNRWAQTGICKRRCALEPFSHRPCRTEPGRPGKAAKHEKAKPVITNKEPGASSQNLLVLERKKRHPSEGNGRDQGAGKARVSRVPLRLQVPLFPSSAWPSPMQFVLKGVITGESVRAYYRQSGLPDTLGNKKIIKHSLDMCLYICMYRKMFMYTYSLE